MKILIFLLVVFFAGCAGSPAWISNQPPEVLRTLPTAALCDVYHLYGQDKIHTELVRRGEFTKNEWRLIHAKKIRVGMSENAFICAWGGPGLNGRINRSASQYGIRKQYVFRGCRSCRGQYVYVKNGMVTGWSD